MASQESFSTPFPEPVENHVAVLSWQGAGAESIAKQDESDSGEEVALCSNLSRIPVAVITLPVHLPEPQVFGPYPVCACRRRDDRVCRSGGRKSLRRSPG